MKTLRVDDQKRVGIPDAQPHQVFSYENHGGGTFILTLVKSKTKEPFPKGSLLKYITPRRNKEQLALLKGCTLETPQ